MERKGLFTPDQEKLIADALDFFFSFNNVVIENGCIIGENSIIEHNVVIQKGTTIGKNSRIRTNSSIGGDGFGFERSDENIIRFPHLGGVIIGDNVEIGANNTVNRMITMAGSSSRASEIYNQLDKKIFKGLNQEEKSDLNKKSKRKLKGEEKWLTKLLSTLAQDLTACPNQNGMLRSG